MKTRYVLLWAGLFCSAPLFSQIDYLRTGSRIGLGESKLSSPLFTEAPKGKMHFMAGGVLIHEFDNEWLSTRADLNFNYTTAIARGSTENIGIFGGTYFFTDEYRFLAINLPLALRLGYAGERFSPYAEVGISVQANVFATEKRAYDNAQMNDQYGYAQRKMNSYHPLSQDIFYTLGIELEAGDDQAYFLEARFFQSLNPMAAVDQQTLNMNVLSIGGGVIFD